jgi:hypothetical protein
VADRTRIRWFPKSSAASATSCRLPFVATAQVDPQPQDAATAILAAFDRHDIVGISAGHRNEKQKRTHLPAL